MGEKEGVGMKSLLEEEVDPPHTDSDARSEEKHREHACSREKEVSDGVMLIEWPVIAWPLWVV